MNAFSTLSLALALSAAATIAAAQDHAHGSHPAHAAAPAQAGPSDLVDAEVKKIDKASGKITLRHGELKNLNMPGMTMAFRVKEAAMLDGLSAGDQVRFKAERVDGSIVVVQLQPAK